MAIRIEIAKIYTGKLECRIGDLSGSSQSYNFTKEEVLSDIGDEIDNLLNSSKVGLSNRDDEALPRSDTNAIDRDVNSTYCECGHVKTKIQYIDDEGDCIHKPDVKSTLHAPTVPDTVKGTAKGTVKGCGLTFCNCGDEDCQHSLKCGDVVFNNEVSLCAECREDTESETQEILNDPEAMKAINAHKARKGDYSDYIPLKDLREYYGKKGCGKSVGDCICGTTVMWKKLFICEECQKDTKSEPLEIATLTRILREVREEIGDEKFIELPLIKNILSYGFPQDRQCEHIWEEHGCAPPYKEFYICTKCGNEKIIKLPGELK